MTPVINAIEPNRLKPHPLNQHLYGDEPDEEFIESCKPGIIEHIHITKEMQIISGHRRHQASLKLGMEKVPVLIRYDLTDPLDVEHALITANKHREKTNEMRAREYQELKRIAAERAKARKEASQFTSESNPNSGTDPDADSGTAEEDFHGAGKFTPTVKTRDFCKKQGQDSVQDSGTKSETNRARESAAKEVGWSGKTADKAAAVVEEIDKAEESGDDKSAQELREALNKGSVSKAHSLTRQRNRDVTPESDAQKKIKRLRTPFNSLVTRLGNMTKEFEELKGQPGGDFITEVMIEDFKSRVDSVKSVIQDVRPVICKSCEGEECAACKWKGYVREY